MMSITSRKFYFICFGVMLILGLYLSIYQSVLSDITASVGASSAFAGLFIALYFLGALLIPAVAGEISDRIGKKYVLLAAVAVMITGIVLVATSFHIILIVLGVFLAGGGSCTLEGLFSAKITDEYPDDSERVMNYSQVFFCVGAVFGPLLVLVVRLPGGAWQTNLYIAAFLLLAAGAAILRLPGDKKAAPEKSGTGKPAAYSFSLIKDVRCFLFFLSMLLYVGAEEGLAFFVMDYFDGASAAFGEISLSLFWASMIVGRFIAGKLHRYSGKIIIICLVMAAVFSLLLQFDNPPVVSVVLYFLAGLGMSAVWPIIMASCTRTFSSTSGTAGGLMMAGGALGGMLVPFLMGFLLSNWGIRSALLVVPVAMLVTLVLSLPALRKK